VKNKFLNLLSESRISEAKEIAYGVTKDKELFLASLGDYFFNTGDLNSALSFYSDSIAENPNPAAQFGVGEILLYQGKIKESVAFFLSAAGKESHRIRSLLKIGIAERLLGNIKASLTAYRLLQKIGYDKAVLYVNIATLLCDLGQYEEADHYYELAISKAPDDAKVRFNYSLHLLAKGDFDNGLKYYESRPWCVRASGPEWLGEPGKRVLVLAEQGFGDLVHFSRFITDAKSISESVALACDPSLFRLFSGLGIDELFDLDSESIKAASSKYPHYCRIMSIPYLMSLDVRSRSNPNLKSDPERVGFWQDLIGSGEGLRVGLCWQGGKRNHSEMIFNDRKRSVNLNVLEPVLQTPGVKFFSLQKDWKEPHPRIIDLMDHCRDFADTASLIANMDLVISVDTAVAHVAGAIGKPVWMLARLGGCWRWGNFGSETFWYPSMTIYRQTVMDDWTTVSGNVARSLADLVNVV